MNFAWSEEQEEFRASVRRFVAERWPVAEVRRLAGSERDYEPAVWKQLTGELGLAGLAIPEAHGGQGFSWLELSIALDELGRELAGGPFFATACLAVRALQHVATPEQQAALLPALAIGETIATLAALDAPGIAQPDAIACRAEGGRLSGEKRWVPDAQNASLLLVAAREPGSSGADGVGLFAIEPGSSGVEVEPAPGLDLTRRLAHVHLDGAAARRRGFGMARPRAHAGRGRDRTRLGAAPPRAASSWPSRTRASAPSSGARSAPSRP